ncbi:hypothetical protein ND747_20080, partial [Frankia sp. R82]|nr:hypothetical protein [Frankia sp. R82]
MAPAAREDRRYDDFGGHAGHGGTAAHIHPHQSAPHVRDGRHSRVADSRSNPDHLDDQYSYGQLRDDYPDEYPPAYPAEPRPRSEPARTGPARHPRDSADPRRDHDPRPGRDSWPGRDRWDDPTGSHRDGYDRADRADRADRPSYSDNQHRADHHVADGRRQADDGHYSDSRPVHDDRYSATSRYSAPADEYRADEYRADRYSDHSRPASRGPGPSRTLTGPGREDYPDDHDAPTGPRPSWQPGTAARAPGAPPYRPRSPLSAGAGA